MKKFYLFLVVALMVSMSLSAQVGYVIPYTPEVAYSGELNVYEYIPYEASEAGEESPERKAYEWFRDTYSNAAGKQYFTVKDIRDGRLLSGGVPVVQVLWINVDRVGYTLGDFDGLYNNSDFKAALRSYVEAGGNLYLSKQATRLVAGIERCTWWPSEYKCDGYGQANDRWYLTNIFCGNFDRSGHAVFSNVTGYDNFHFPMTYGDGADYRRTDNNCGWGDWNLYAPGIGGCEVYPDGDNEGKNKRVVIFESAQNCQILGGFGHTQDMDYAGMIEFFPRDNYKGTVIVMGLAAYQWGTSNKDVINVKLLTQGILDYLSARPDVTWGDAPATGSISPGTTVTITPALNAASVGKATITHYVTSSANIVDYHDLGSAEPGAVYFNYFGTATLSAKVKGDGIHFPKSEITAATTHSITVNGGTAAAPRFAYVLPYPFNVISDANYDGESGKMPDFETAKWFYEQFIRDGIAYKDVTRYGCFIRPSDLASLPSSVKVLWIHNDRSGQTSESYYNDLGGNTFVTALKNFVANNGNVFVSKQATRLVGDLGRNDYPSYPNTGYENRGPWRIGNHWNLNGKEIDHSTHAVYAGLVKDYSGSTSIMNSGRHTNNNHIWENWGDLPGKIDAGRLTGYQDAHNCRILGAWGHYNESAPISNEFECVGFAEYYPQENVTLHMGGDPYNQVGTIIAMGLAAYHWVDPTDQIKTLTRDILYYLNIDEVPAFDWITEPVNGEIESDQIVQVEYKAADIRWESSNDDIVEITPDPSNPSDPDYKKLLLKAEGSVTISAIRYADGYQIPKNVQDPYVLSKTIQVTPYIYIRDVPANHYGTICLPRASASLSAGMTVYRILSDQADGIMLEQVNAMEAGVPYFFYSTVDQITVTMTGAAVLTPQNGNGLIGNLGPDPVEIPNDPDNYILGNDNSLYYIDMAGIMLGANRAYLDRSEIVSASASPGAPKRVMGAHRAPQSTTGMEQLENETNGNGKRIQDGQLIIRHGDNWYNATGVRIK